MIVMPVCKIIYTPTPIFIFWLGWLTYDTLESKDIVPAAAVL